MSTSGFGRGLAVIAAGLAASMMLASMPASAVDSPPDAAGVQSVDDPTDDPWGPDWDPSWDDEWDTEIDADETDVVEIPGAAQSVTLSPIDDLSVGERAEVVAKATSGLPVVFTTAGQCSLMGTLNGAMTVRADEPGTCTVGASQPGQAGVWEPAPVQTVSFTIAPSAVLLLARWTTPQTASTKAYAKPGSSVELTVDVVGAYGDWPQPEGTVRVYVDDVETASRSVGHQSIAFAAPTKKGVHSVQVKYNGDSRFVEAEQTLELVSGKVPSATGATIEATVKPEALVDGDRVVFTAQVSPAASNGKVTFTWVGHDQPGDVVATNGASSITFDTDELHWGEYPVTIEYTGTDRLGKTFLDSEDVPVKVDPADTGKAEVNASTTPSGEYTVVSKALTRTKATAPEARIEASKPTWIRVFVPTAPVNAKVLVRFQSAGVYETLGYGRVAGNKTLLLPAMTASAPGTFYVRIVPEQSNPVYLRVRAIPPAPEPIDYNDPNRQFKSLALGFFSELAKDLIGMIPGVKNFKGSLGWGVAKGLNALQDPPPPDKIDKAKAEILTELDNASKKLDSISADIATLSNSLDNKVCQITSAMSTDPVSRIQSLQRRYLFLENLDRSAVKNLQSGQAPAKNTEAWTQWANEVDASGNGALESALAIQNLMMGLGGQPGTLVQCAKALKSDWELGKFPLLGEKEYYTKLWAYITAMQSYQILALNLDTEAKHYQALMAYQNDVQVRQPVKNADGTVTEPTPKPELANDEIQDLCLLDYSAYDLNGKRSPAYYCGLVSTFTSDLYDWMAKQTITAGAGYSLDQSTQGLVSTRASDPNLLWATDLSGYNVDSVQTIYGSEAPISVPYSVTTGTTGGFEGSQATGYGLEGWRIASTSDWRSVLNSTTNAGQGVYDVMKARGFFRNPKQAYGRNLIIYTGETTPVIGDDVKQSAILRPLPWANNHWFYLENPFNSWVTDGKSTAMCLFDTAMTFDDTALPYCGAGKSNGQVNANIATLFNHVTINDMGLIKGIDEGLSANTKSANWTTPRFYQAQTIFNEPRAMAWRGTAKVQVWDFTKPPAYVANADRNATPEASYRWPVLDLVGPEVACTPVTVGEGSNVRTYPMTDNVAQIGVRSMCGSNFNWWFFYRMGNPPPKTP